MFPILFVHYFDVTLHCCFVTEELAANGALVILFLLVNCFIVSSHVPIRTKTLLTNRTLKLSLVFVHMLHVLL